MNHSETIDNRDRLKSALIAIREMRSKLDAIESAKKEPIAIIGIGCRFPGGANDPETFWQILHEGIDAISEVPSDRWNIDEYYDPDPDSPGKMYVRNAGFIREVDRFDAKFFGITPREATNIDPQQRLLLEAGWEAVEMLRSLPNDSEIAKQGCLSALQPTITYRCSLASAIAILSMLTRRQEIVLMLSRVAYLIF
jgi:hypothetical protein